MTQVRISALALAAILAAGAAQAGEYRSDRGFDEVKSYQTGADRGVVTRTVAEPQIQPQRRDKGLSDAAKAFGTPHPNFESGRR